MAKTQVQNVTQTTSNIGPSQQPYYNALMQGASTLLNAPIQRYVNAQGEPIGRIAGFTQQQQNLQNQIAGMQTPGQFGQATNYMDMAAQGTLANAQYTPGQFNAQQIAQPNLNYFQMAAPQQFGGAQAQQYMSPYVQNVLEIQKREALNDAKRGQLAQSLGASRQGAYGGSRQLLASMERERNLGQQMGDIQARGLQSAYENAQQQFERDRAAGMTAGQQNLSAALETQRLGATTGLEALRANQQADLERQRMGEQSRQFGAGHGLAAYGQMGQFGQTMANIGQAQQNADIARYGLQTTTAAQQQALNQQKLDTAYADWQKEVDNPYIQLQRYGNLMSGVPQATTTTSTSSAPAPGVGQQLLGAGLGAYSTYRMFGGG